jgi:hypothetical protein
MTVHTIVFSHDDGPTQHIYIDHHPSHDETWELVVRSVLNWMTDVPYKTIIEELGDDLLDFTVVGVYEGHLINVADDGSDS